MFTFERMTRRYTGDLNVWLKYVEYCEINGFENKLAVLYPKYEAGCFFNALGFYNFIPVLKMCG